jgi:tetraacyldisaccharide 4'-kinase
MTRYMARQVQRLGLKAAIVSRGYKGTAEKVGGIVSDGKRILMDAGSAGDEPYMLATGLTDVPVAVGRDRYAAAMALMRACHPDVIILDDGFQHLPLARDLNVVLLDRSRPFGNAYLLPRGPLREPLCALQRGDVFILTHRGTHREPEGRRRIHQLPDRPVLKASTKPVVNRLVRARQRTEIRPEISPAADLSNRLKAKQVLLFSGLADNQGFRNTVEKAGATVVDALHYSDHYNYTDSDLSRIISAAVRRKAELIMTTTKDFVRIDPQTTWPLDLLVLDLEIDLGQDREALKHILVEHLALNPPDAGKALL